MAGWPVLDPREVQGGKFGRPGRPQIGRLYRLMAIGTPMLVR
jgi:hypothetical protein